MTAALRPRYTLSDYLEIEQQSGSVRHEYVAGEVFAMAGGSVEHSALSSALIGLLFGHLRGGPCRPHGADLRLWIDAAEVATYADVAVVCDPVERHPSSPTHVTNPRVIVEVLSASTERYDREQKRLYYQTLSSLVEYAVIAQDRRLVEVWRRGADGWEHQTFGAGETMAFSSIASEFEVDALYDAAGVS